MKTKLTVRELKNLGIFDKVAEYLGIRHYALNEGLMDYDTVLEFDSEFKKEDEIEIKKLSDIIDEIFKVAKAYKSIAISPLVYKGLLKQRECDSEYLFGLPIVVSEDLNFADYQLLKFDITKVIN